MRTIEEYHDGALDALARAGESSAPLEARTHALAEAAVYAELAKTAPDQQVEETRVGGSPDGPRFLIAPAQCGKPGTLVVPGLGPFTGAKIAVTCAFPPDHDPPCAFDRPPSPPTQEFAT